MYTIAICGMRIGIFILYNLRNMKKVQLVSIILFAILIVASCSQKAYMQQDKSIDFTNINTYAWADGDDDKDYATKRTNMNELRDRTIHATVDKYMQEHGWKLDEKKPDVYLVFDVVVDSENREISTPVYSQPMTRWFYNPAGRRWVPIYYPSNFLGYNNTTQTVKEGTLTLTLMNPSNDKVIWQGWTSSEIYGKRITDAQIDRTVKAIVSKLKKF